MVLRGFWAGLEWVLGWCWGGVGGSWWGLGWGLGGCLGGGGCSGVVCFCVVYYCKLHAYILMYYIYIIVIPIIYIYIYIML